jgi:hypothetical protein
LFCLIELLCLPSSGYQFCTAVFAFASVPYKQVFNNSMRENTDDQSEPPDQIQSDDLIQVSDGCQRTIHYGSIFLSSTLSNYISDTTYELPVIHRRGSLNLLFSLFSLSSLIVVFLFLILLLL